MNKKNIFISLGLMILCGFLFMFKLGEPSLFETDEYIYTNLAKEIVKTGEWLILRLDGKGWFIHPPLYMWLTAMIGAVFGFSEFVARFWNALFGAGLVVLTFFFGRMLFNERTGIFAALVLATSLQFIIQSRMAIFDVPLVFFIVLAAYFFLSARRAENKNLYYLSYASMGLGILTKGPIAAALPMLIILTYLFICRDIKSLKEAKVPTGLLLTFLVGGSWYLIALILHGREFWDRAIMYYTIGRYFGVVEGHAGPIWSYIPVVFFGFLPWAAFIPAIIAFLVRERSSKEASFLLTWVSFVFVFFSLGGTKLPGYILSIYPFLALGAAALFDRCVSSWDSAFLKKWMNASFATLFVYSLFFAFVAWYISWNPLVEEYVHLVAGLVPILVLLCVSGIASSCLYLGAQRIEAALAMLVFSMIVFIPFFTSSTVPAIEMYKPMRPLGMKIAEISHPKDLVVGYETQNKMSYEYYLGRKIKWISAEPGFLRAVSAGKNMYCLIGEGAYKKLKDKLPPQAKVIDIKARIVLLHIK